MERRLVAPFYLKMMGSNATFLDKRTYRRLVRVGRKATSTEVRALLRGGSLTVDAWYEAAAESPDRAALLTHVTGLAPDHLPWRPVVMGSWLSLACRPEEIADDILFSLARCDGDLTAAPLSTAAVLIAGDAAVETLRSNRLRADEYEADAVAYLDAALERLGEVPVEPPGEGMREHFRRIVEFGVGLRHDLTR
ncbi:hypothetical protein [Nocardioides luteus]|uniref:hypothetical protein n=1 Tax=Nocardioides luteus TaxID=1844 RepID=UPI0018CA28AF|nr:hypothetical protein [Nocardioides luteus]MBG6098458.1 hypothetical protein [Nocardioides luteus]